MGRSSVTDDAESVNFEELESLLYQDQTFSMADTGMLDENEDLPIRKPQSAYVIFGKMVSISS
jgi:hypothetical protein